MADASRLSFGAAVAALIQAAKVGLRFDQGLRQIQDALDSEPTSYWWVPTISTEDPRPALRQVLRTYMSEALPSGGVLLVPVPPSDERDPLGWIAEHTVKIVGVSDD